VIYSTEQVSKYTKGCDTRLKVSHFFFNRKISISNKILKLLMTFSKHRHFYSLSALLVKFHLIVDLYQIRDNYSVITASLYHHSIQNSYQLQSLIIVIRLLSYIDYELYTMVRIIVHYLISVHFSRFSYVLCVCDLQSVHW
jgi:hypothetical protein